MSEWIDLIDLLMGPVDELVGDFLGDILTDTGPGDSGILPEVSGDKAIPANNKVGTVRQGWKCEKRTRYVLNESGRGTHSERYNVWSKEYNNMGFSERAAYFQGKRVQAYDSRKAKNRAYKRGFNNGAKAQQRAEKTAESGGTPLVTYTPRR